MKDCTSFRRQIEDDLDGDSVSPELPALVEHCRTCAECGALLDAARALRGAAVIETDADKLAEVRRAVLRQARLEAFKPSTPWWSLHPSRLLVPFAAIAVVAVGAFLLGRESGRSALQGELPTELRGLATPAASPARDALDSPFTYSNVRFVPGADTARVHLEFDVSAHLEVDRPESDPLVAEVVAQAISAGTSPLGSRLKALALAGHLTDRRVKSALIAALLGDPSPAVRVGALTALERDRQDTAVQQAVFQALASENSEQVRLLAVDFLAGAVDRSTLVHAVDRQSGETGTPLQIRLSQDFAPK